MTPREQPDPAFLISCSAVTAGIATAISGADALVCFFITLSVLAGLCSFHVPKDDR